MKPVVIVSIYPCSNLHTYYVIDYVMSIEETVKSIVYLCYFVFNFWHFHDISYSFSSFCLLTWSCIFSPYFIRTFNILVSYLKFSVRGLSHFIFALVWFRCVLCILWMCFLLLILGTFYFVDRWTFCIVQERETNKNSFIYLNMGPPLLMLCLQCKILVNLVRSGVQFEIYCCHGCPEYITEFKLL